MKKSGRLICGSLSLALCVSASGCAGQGLKNLFVWDRTAGYKTLDEMENGSKPADPKAVASSSASADEEDSTWRGRLASWSPFGGKDTETAGPADPFLNEGDATDQIAAVSQSRTLEESAESRKSIDDAMQKSTAETEHLFADLKPKSAVVPKSAAPKAAAPKTETPRSPRKAIEDLDALLTTEARNRNADEVSSDVLNSAPKAEELLGQDEEGSEAVAMFDPAAEVKSSKSGRTSRAKPRSIDLLADMAANSKASAFDELVTGVQSVSHEVADSVAEAEESVQEETVETKSVRNNRLARAEENFFNTLQVAKEVRETARRDPFEAAATVAQRMSDDSSFEWTRPAAESEDISAHHPAVNDKRSVFSNAAFQNVAPASDSHRVLNVPVTTVSSAAVVPEPVPADGLADSSDPFFSAAAAPAAITDTPVETVAAAAGQTPAPGIWKTISLRNVILVVGAIIVAFLLFAPNRKEAA